MRFLKTLELVSKVSSKYFLDFIGLFLVKDLFCFLFWFILFSMMMMNWLWGLIDWRKAFSLISSQDHC